MVCWLAVYVPCLVIQNPIKKGHSKKDQKNGFQAQLSRNVGQKYCRLFCGEHSVLLLTFITLLFSLKILHVLGRNILNRLRQSSYLRKR